MSKLIEPKFTFCEKKWKKWLIFPLKVDIIELEHGERGWKKAKIEVFSNKGNVFIRVKFKKERMKGKVA